MLSMSKKIVSFAFIALLIVIGAFLMYRTSSQEAKKIKPGSVLFQDDAVVITLPSIPLLQKKTPYPEADHASLHTRRSQHFIAPRDMWITGYAYEIKNAPFFVNHHMKLFSMKQPQLPEECEVYRKIVSLARGHVPMEIPSGYGFFLEKGEVLIFYAEAAVPADWGKARYEDVIYSLTLKRSEEKNLKPIKRFHIRIGEGTCGAPFTVPAHTENFIVKSRPDLPLSTFTFPADGTIIGMAAHYHPWNGGKLARAYLNGTLLHTFVPHKKQFEYGEDWVMPPTPVTAWKVKKGDRLTYEVIYQNPGPDEIPMAMAIIEFLFSEDAP